MSDMMDFDPAAFGLPSGFGAKKGNNKPKQAAFHERTKRVDIAKENGDGIAKDVRELGNGENNQQNEADHGTVQAEAGPGPSSLLRKQNGNQDPRETEDDAEPSPQTESKEQPGPDDADNDDNNEAEDDEDAPDTDYFPVSHEIIMKDHTKAVTALSIDPPGARVVTGSYDYDVKLWDFGGMQGDYRPFKTIEPYPNYHVHDVVWDSTGANFIAVAGTLQAKVYDREGNQLMETTKGDMYIRDMKNTSGHTGQITSASWHPKDAGKFLTSSYDSTVRMWDLKELMKCTKTIVLKSKDRGSRTKITKALYSDDGRNIAAAAQDGTINVWATNSNFARPNATAENAHEKGTETSGLTFSSDSRTLISRGGDDTVKLWDIRAFKKPLAVAASLPSRNVETNVIFSPDEQYILTGTAGPMAGLVPGKEVDVRGKPGGRVVVLKRDNLELVKEFNISQGSVIRVAWHNRINQILATTSLGEIHVLYSPNLSVKGATLAAGRAPRARRAVDDYDPTNGPIITPHALPMFKDQTYDVSDSGYAGKRKREVGKNTILKSRKPEPPVKGPGSGGRVGEAADRHVIMGMIKGDIRSEDPREALLKYAAKEGDKQWTSAWGKDQKTIFDTRPIPEDEEPQNGK